MKSEGEQSWSLGRELEQKTPGNGVYSVLIVLPVFSKGGAESVLATIARFLAKSAACHVTVVSLGGASAATPDIGNATLRLGTGNGKAGSEWKLFLFSRHKKKYDLVLSSHLRINAALCVMRKLGLLKTSRLVTRESAVLADRSGLMRMFVYRCLYRCYGTQDMIVAQTSYMADRLREVLPSRLQRRIKTIPNPIDLASVQAAAAERIPPTIAKLLIRRPHVIWCGRFVEVKQPLRAVDTVAYLRQRLDVDVGLIMIGSGPLRRQVEKRVDELDLLGKVCIAGQLQNPYAVMSKCAYGLLTSKWEGFPNVVLEMLACGIPRIVSTDCAKGLAALPGVITLSDHSPEALAHAFYEIDDATQQEKVEDTLLERTPDRFIKTILTSITSFE